MKWYNISISEDLQRKLTKDYMPVIYKNIRKFRKSSGMSIMELSCILDITPEYLKRIESEGDVKKTCSLKLLIKLSIIFEKGLDEFLKED